MTIDYYLSIKFILSQSIPTPKDIVQINSEKIW